MNSPASSRAAEIWQFAFAVELGKLNPSLSEKQALRIAATIYSHASGRTPAEAAKAYPFTDLADGLTE